MLEIKLEQPQMYMIVYRAIINYYIYTILPSISFINVSFLYCGITRDDYQVSLSKAQKPVMVYWLLPWKSMMADEGKIQDINIDDISRKYSPWNVVLYTYRPKTKTLDKFATVIHTLKSEG